MRDIIHCGNDGTISGTAGHALHELTIDLYQVGRQVLQLCKRTESRAKIIQRETTAYCAEVANKALRLLQICNRAGLGYLEYD